MNKKKSSEMSDPLFRYIAGAFDVGGCINIIVPRKNQETQVASLLIWVTSKNFKLMEILQTRGALITQKADGQYRAKWKDQRAYNLLKQLFPHLTVRKEQAKIGIEFMEEKNSNPTPQTDAIYRLRLKLCKRKDEDEGGK